MVIRLLEALTYIVTGVLLFPSTQDPKYFESIVFGHIFSRRLNLPYCIKLLQLNGNKINAHIKVYKSKTQSSTVHQAKSRKYRGMFEVNSPEKITTSSGKGLVSTSRTYASHKWDGTKHKSHIQCTSTFISTFHYSVIVCLHIFAVTYITEISLNVTLSNQSTIHIRYKITHYFEVTSLSRIFC